MSMLFAWIVPLLFLISFVFALHKKVRVYDTFTDGAKGAIELVVSVFPYLCAVTMLTQLLEESGLTARIQTACAPAFSALGIPSELLPLLFIKPLSGSGAIATLSNVIETYGVDSYIARCACVLYGSSETIFYIGSVYFAGLKRKKIGLALGISLCAYLLSALLCCQLCKIV